MPNQNELEADRRAHALAAEGQIVRTLGPGETPKRAEDIVHEDGTRKHGELIGSPSLEEAEAHGNPILPVDSSGHKVHPSDAFSKPIMADVERARGFGGAADASAETYRVTERIDPQTGELVRQKIGEGGEVLDEQREPAPQMSGSRMGLRREDTVDERDQRYQQYRRDESNGPVL